MVSGIIDILVGFIIGWIQNTDWFKSIPNMLYIELSKRNIRKIKNEDDTLESFYKELYKAKRMQYYTIIDTLIVYSIILFLMVGIILALLNLFTSPLRVGNIIIPQWGLFALGYILSIIYNIIKTKLKGKVTYLDFSK